MSAHHSLVPPWRRLLAGLAAGSMIFAAPGCGSSNDATADDGKLSAAAQECMDNANEYFDDRGQLPDSLPAELTPLSKSPAKGLTITRLFPGSVPTSAALSQKIVDIAPEIGWTGKALSYDGSVEDVNRKALAAIEDSDIVIVDGLPTAALQGPIKAAKEKGVLLMLGSITEAPQSIPGFGATPLGGDLYVKMGELAAYAFMQATNCQGKTAAFGLPVEAMQTLADSMGDVLQQECEDCAYSYSDIPFSDIGSPAATNAVVSKLQSDPSINFAFFTIGDLAVGIEPALKQAGIDAKIGGAIPVPSNLAALKKGENSFWLGVPQGMTAWINFDTALRAMDSGQPTVGDHYPVPVFTPDNIESTDPIPVYPKDYEEQFKALWKISS
jgi:ABC-type sugar transport system substrate-binding protein